MTEIVDCIAWIVRKTFWSLGVFLEFFFKRVFDLLGLCFNIAACCTIVRLPAMVFQLTHMKSWWEWRFLGFVQLLIFIMDVPIIVMGLFILCTLIRIYPLAAEIKKKDVIEEYSSGDIAFTGFEIRGLIIKHFFLLFTDLFCLFFVLVCLFSWRSCIFYRKFQDADTMWKRRVVIFTEFLQVILDVPLILCLLLSLCTWRLPFLCIDLKHYISADKKWNKIRFLGLLHLSLALVDIPCIVAFLITLLSWRSPVLIYTLIGSDALNRHRHWKSHWKIRKVIFYQFLYLFCDIPVIVSAIFVLVTIWRMPALIQEVKKHLHKEYNRKNFYKREFAIRGSCLKQFGMVWIDFFSCILAIIVFVTLWRADPLRKDIKKCYGKYKENAEKSEKSPSSVTEANGVDKEDKSTNKGVETMVVSKNDGSVVMDTIDVSKEHEISNEEATAQTDEKTEKKLTWSQCMWKIRRKIAFHFGMIIIDLPAIPLAVLLLVTGLRTSKLLSALLGGQFYMLFAVSVYMETLKLFRDIAFIFIFIILMALRPIQSWVHLLEDEEHREYRLLCELIVWVPDICTDRGIVYDMMADRLALYIKQQKGDSFITGELQTILRKHLKRIEELLTKLDDYELEGEFTSLLKMVEFVENKRVGKMIRKYHIEYNYINRCDPNLHNENLRKYKDEMRKFEQEVVAAYEILLNYKPDKVPLYANKCGLKLRSGKETRKVLLDCLPRGRFLVAIMAFVCLLFVYRAPKMFKALRRRTYDRYNIVLGTLKEYGKDLLTLLRILVVFIFLYRAPIVIADILDCLIEKRSWKAVRKIVKRHPPEMIEDFSRILKNLFSWKTLRFIFTMILFGVLMPAELFLTVVKTRVKDKCYSFFLTIILYAIFVVGPFVFILYGVEKILNLQLGWVIAVVICVFVLLLLIQLQVMIVSMTRVKEKMFLLAVPKCDYVRLNWFNIHVLIFEMLEFLQTLALVFKFPFIPMYGGQVLRTISAYLLFSFFSYDAIFWITVVIFGIWFFLCGAPHIFENILESYDTGTIAKRPSWRLSLSLLANTLFVTIIENLSSSLACNYTPCSTYDVFSNVSMIALGNTTNNSLKCISPYLVEDPSVQCWTGRHVGHATFALFAIVWYTTTSLIFGTQYGDSDNHELDIGFSPIYNMIINVFKAGMIVVATVVTDNHYIVLGLLIAGYALCLFYSVSFRCLFHEEPCNLRSVMVWRFCTFISCIFASIGIVVAFVLNDTESIIPLLIFLIGTFVTFCVSVIAAIKLSETSSVERDREDFKKEIVAFEERLSKDKWMHERWQKERKTWLRLIGSVREAWKDDRNLNSGATMDVDSANVSNEPSIDIVPVYTPPHDEEIDIPPPPYDDETGSPSSDLIHDSPPLSLPTVECINAGQVAPPNYQSTFTTETIEHLYASPTYYLPDSALELEKNGRNLLLILEKYVLYTAYRYSSLSQRNIWINMVCDSNWSGLLQQLRILNVNLKGTYDKPSALDISLANVTSGGYKLNDDEQDKRIAPTTFVKKTKEEIKIESNELRNATLKFFGEVEVYGESYRELFDKLLPTGPVFKSSICSDGVFDITFRRSSTAVITEFEPPGLKIAVGASITIGKKLYGRVDGHGLEFKAGFKPVGKKGPISVAVETLSFLRKSDHLYIMANGKKVKFDVALSSCKTVKWS